MSQRMRIFFLEPVFTRSAYGSYFVVYTLYASTKTHCAAPQHYTRRVLGTTRAEGAKAVRAKKILIEGGLHRRSHNIPLSCIS